MTPLAQRRYTPEEYLARERSSPERHEYVHGQIHAMTGGSSEHAILALDVAAEIRARTRGRGCVVYQADMRGKVDATGLYTYPDVAAVCGGARLEDARRDTLLNPSLVVEVLSESTERYDRGEKFAHYRRLQSLREYVLVAQDRMRVALYERDGERWIYRVLDEPDAVLEIPSLGCALPLHAIYADVDLPPHD